MLIFDNRKRSGSLLAISYEPALTPRSLRAHSALTSRLLRAYFALTSRLLRGLGDLERILFGVAHSKRLNEAPFCALNRETRSGNQGGSTRRRRQNTGIMSPKHGTPAATTKCNHRQEHDLRPAMQLDPKTKCDQPRARGQYVATNRRLDGQIEIDARAEAETGRCRAYLARRIVGEPTATAAARRPNSHLATAGAAGGSGQNLARFGGYADGNG